MGNPFETEEVKKEQEPELLQNGYSFEELVDMAIAKAKQDVSKSLLADSKRSWKKVQELLGSEEALQEKFIGFVELKLKAAKNKERKA